LFVLLPLLSHHPPPPRYLPPFPTRRSSDLAHPPPEAAAQTHLPRPTRRRRALHSLRSQDAGGTTARRVPTSQPVALVVAGVFGRSEEHTSELQSLTNLVFPLLL